MGLQRCSKCVMPETQETILFNDHGVCNICVQQEYKQTQMNWTAKKSELEALLALYQGKYEYDCIVPFSGGKDSTFTLYYLMKEFGLKPLVVRFDHGFMRRGVEENTHRTLRKLGADCVRFTPSWRVVQRLMLQSFLEKGDFCWHCHAGIFAYPMQVAVKENIPLVIWGEPSAEYTAYYSYQQAEEIDEKHFNRYVNLGINASDMLIRSEGALEERDLLPYVYPSSSELRRIGFRSVCLGSYIPWDVKKQVAIIQRELEWKGDEVEGVPPGYSYEKIECYMQGVRDYIKFIKRGFTRPAHLASIDIRNHRLTRDEAMVLIKKYEGLRPPSLDLFLDYVGLTEAEFMQVALSHGVSPYQHDPSKTKTAKKVADFEQWPREGKMPREDAEKQLARHNRRNGVDKAS